MALQGGEPGGPSSVLGRYALAEVGSRLRAGGTSVLGRPNGETTGIQKQERRTSFVGLADNSTAPFSEPSAFEYSAARRAERFEAEGEERGSGGGQLPTARQPTSRVQRVADFAKWATQVAEAAKADAVAVSETDDWQKERRRRKSATHTAPMGATEKPAVPPPFAATRRRRSLVLLRARHGRLRD